MSSNLAKRLLFVLWAIPLGWWVINSRLNLVPPSFAQSILNDPGAALYPGHILAVILVFLATSEYIAMLSISFPRNAFWLVYLWITFQLTSHFAPQFGWSNTYDTYVLLLLVAFESIFWGKNTGRWKRASLLFSGTIFLSLAGVSLFYFFKSPFTTVFPPIQHSLFINQTGIVTVVAAIFMCDSAAFFAGKALGKHHFSSISPKKTIEGSVAGLITATVVTTVGWHFFSSGMYHIGFGIGLGILIGIFAQAGDLLASSIKRYFHVKDASNIIPGHGGILDRFDSVFFTAPIVNLYLIILTKSIG